MKVSGHIEVAIVISGCLEWLLEVKEWLVDSDGVMLGLKLRLSKQLWPLNSGIKQNAEEKLVIYFTYVRPGYKHKWNYTALT